MDDRKNRHSQERQIMNEFLELIKTRRSIRHFQKTMPSREQIEAIVEAGLYAPSGRNFQSTRILVVTSSELREQLRKDNCAIGGWSEDHDPFYGAPVILIVIADKSNPNAIYDGSLVMENLMLAAHALGLGSIWINRARQEFETEPYQNLLKELGIEGEWEGIDHCAIGQIDGEVPKAALRKPDRIVWIE